MISYPNIYKIHTDNARGAAIMAPVKPLGFGVAAELSKAQAADFAAALAKRKVG